MSPISTRICVPNLVAVRRSCGKRGEGVQTDRQRKLQLYIVDNTANDIVVSGELRKV